MITVKLIHIAGEESLPLHVATRKSHSTKEDALHEAWLGTQNVAGSWITSRGCNGISIEPVPGLHPRYRSTLVGDYAQVIDSDGSESYWQRHDSGWQEIKFMPPQSLVRQATMMRG